MTNSNIHQSKTARFASMTRKWGVFTELWSWLVGNEGCGSGAELLCHRIHAKWSAVWRGHPRPAHLDNELRCNPKLRWTTVYPMRSPSLVPSHQSALPFRASSLSPSLLSKIIFSPPPDPFHPFILPNLLIHHFSLLSHFLPVLSTLPGIIWANAKIPRYLGESCNHIL